MDNSVVVVIPIYKQNITVDEKLAIVACYQVLGKYPIVFVCGKNLQTETYKKIVQEENGNFNKITFADNNFGNFKSYNRFCMNSKFYKTFSEYKYMMLYQLDAFVFRDELEFWIEKNYDYIGAPWYNDRKGAKIPEDKLTLFGVGNGGFSLRKIGTLYRLFRNPVLYFLCHIKLKIKIKEYIHALGLMLFGKNEDIVIHRFGKAGMLEIPSEQEALNFAFDTHPALSFRLNGEKLPFGCHAWEKNKNFWKNHIKK